MRVSAAAVVLCLAGLVHAKPKQKLDPVSYNHPPEVHHSMRPPLDKSQVNTATLIFFFFICFLCSLLVGTSADWWMCVVQVYWNFGGSTVLTRKLIRITPDTQDRQGWLWNEYPIVSDLSLLARSRNRYEQHASDSKEQGAAHKRLQRVTSSRVLHRNPRTGNLRFHLRCSATLILEATVLQCGFCPETRIQPSATSPIFSMAPLWA